MTTSADLIDHTIGEQLAPQLKKLGFSKSARNFRRATAASLQVVNIQGSAWNFPDSASFTVNLAAHFPAVVAAFDEAVVSRAPAEYRCHVHTRIGRLTPESQDLWWKLSSNADVESVARDLASTVSTFGLPWLNGLADSRQAADYCRSKSLFAYAAVLATSAGDREQAASDLARALCSPGPHHAVLRVWAASEKLTPVLGISRL